MPRVLRVAGLLADEHQSRCPRPASEHCLGGRLVEIASLARTRRRCQRLQAARIRDELARPGIFHVSAERAEGFDCSLVERLKIVQASASDFSRSRSKVQPMRYASYRLRYLIGMSDANKKRDVRPSDPATDHDDDHGDARPFIP